MGSRTHSMRTGWPSTVTTRAGSSSGILISMGLWTTPGHDPEKELRDSVPITDFFYPSMRRICFQQADIVIAEDGLRVDTWGRANLARAIGAALHRASLVLNEETLNDAANC
jgi:hypothetical protein